MDGKWLKLSGDEGTAETCALDIVGPEPTSGETSGPTTNFDMVTIASMLCGPPSATVKIEKAKQKYPAHQLRTSVGTPMRT